MQELVAASTEQTNEVVKSESANTQSGIRDLKSVIQTSHRDAERQALIHSFSFDGMFAREASIHPAAKNTYGWVLESEPPTDLPFDSFVDWLQGDQPLYWVSGKAGSGKSTLINYIWGYRKEDRDALLSRWAADNRLVTAAVFFWNPGGDLQKSVAGLLRSLLYQGELCRTKTKP